MSEHLYKHLFIATYVFILVAISRILFRANDLTDAGVVMKKILSGPYEWRGLGGKTTLAICFAIIVTVLVSEAVMESGLWRRHLARRRLLRTGLALIALAITLAVGDFEGGRFIYVQF